MRYLLSSVVIGMVFPASALPYDSWPQWRGPNRDAVSRERNLLDRWDAAPPLIWKAKGVGGGYAGVVVDHGLVCTMGDRNGQPTVLAISDRDGKEIWTAPIGECDGRGRHRESKCTPTIDGDRVYAVTSEGNLACLKITTGERMWARSYMRDFGGIASQYGYAESPLIDGDKLICSPGGPEAGIVALDKKTGAELWRCPLSFEGEMRPEGASYSSMVISHGAGIKQYVQMMTSGLVGVDAKAGKQLWSYSRVGAVSHPCTPIVCGDYVFVPCGYYLGSALLKLAPKGDGGAKASKVYFLKSGKLETHSGGAVAVGGYVYGSHVRSGCPQCIDFLTGKPMWKNGRGPGTGPAAVLYADGSLYFCYENGVVAMVGASPDKYQLKGKFRATDNTDPCWAHPAVCNGRLYLRNGGIIYCYGLKK